jgi:hypothetical protein
MWVFTRKLPEFVLFGRDVPQNLKRSNTLKFSTGSKESIDADLSRSLKHTVYPTFVVVHKTTSELLSVRNTTGMHKQQEQGASWCREQVLPYSPRRLPLNVKYRCDTNIYLDGSLSATHDRQNIKNKINTVTFSKILRGRGTRHKDLKKRKWTTTNTHTVDW